MISDNGMDMLQHAATVNGSVPSDTNITDDTNASANQRLADTGNSFDADTPSAREDLGTK